MESSKAHVVGVNAYCDGEHRPIETLAIDKTAERLQRDRLRKLRRSRDASAVGTALDGVRRAASGTDNLMPPILEAVRAYATLGEICDALRDELGVHSERPAI